MTEIQRQEDTDERAALVARVGAGIVIAVTDFA